MPGLGKRAALAAGAALMVAATSGAQTPLWVPTTRDTDAVDTVWVHMQHKDCPSAVHALNDGINKELPSVLLLAGAMFEDGVCLKPSWPRALGYYERAHAAGHPRAAAKIAAGFAAPAAGPDRAAALWWALREGQALPAECRTVQSLVDDPDRFVAALRAWPAQRLVACAYVAGVIGTMNGDLEFSRRAAAHGLKGVLVVHFKPADGAFDIVTEQLEFIAMGGLVSGEAIRDRETRSMKGEFERDIRAAMERALRRYARPEGMDRAWKVSVSFHFNYVLR